MSIVYDPAWHHRLAAADAAAAVREQVEHHHDVESGLVVEPGIVFSRRRRLRVRRREALARWISEGYGRKRMEGLA
jgi:hypothetical protein